MYSVLILSLLVPPKENLHIFSFTSCLHQLQRAPPSTAELFLPPQESPGGGSLFVLLPCLLGLLSYVVAAAILRKLDQLELRRAAVVPLCGQDGLFKYEIQVKTGWGPGAGKGGGG